MPNNAMTQEHMAIARGDAAGRHRSFHPGDARRWIGVRKRDGGGAAGSREGYCPSRRARRSRTEWDSICDKTFTRCSYFRDEDNEWLERRGIPSNLVNQWLTATFPQGAPAPVADPHPNRESTALKLADQGCFWVGAQRKQMPYGTIAQGQMYVQYMIPAEKRHPYPVVMVHGGGGQGTHMILGNPVDGRGGCTILSRQATACIGFDRPSYGRSPYHPDALGPSHLPNVPPYEGLLQSTAVFNTAQWPGPGGMNDPVIDQFMACEQGNVSDEAFHSDLAWRGGVELVDRIGPCILLTHAFGGFFAWGVADRRPNLIKGIFAMEINGNPFAAQLRWGLDGLSDDLRPSHNRPFAVSPWRITRCRPMRLSPAGGLVQAAGRARPTNGRTLQGIPVGWLTTEFGGGGSPVPNVEFLKQVGMFRRNGAVEGLRNSGEWQPDASGKEQSRSLQGSGRLADK